jgi:outer membrane protein OmpA-like peptidoglycan-associated protein
MKVYLEEHRVINLPNMGRWTGNALHFYFRSNTYDAKPASPLMTGLSLHAGGTELYDALMAGGRLAVPGVYFDTGSDRIRPESSGTLREILDMLSAHPDLRLVIEGHTDNVGDSGKNKTLSEQRALAVLTYLVEHGTTRARLQSAGFGDTKPSAPNDSPENRQRNRRVELVVQQ